MRENAVLYATLRIFSEDVLELSCSGRYVNQVLIRPEGEVPSGSNRLGKLDDDIVTVRHIDIHHLERDVEVAMSSVGIILITLFKICSCEGVEILTLILCNLNEVWIKHLDGFCLLKLDILERQPVDIVVGSDIEHNLQYAVITNSTGGRYFLQEEALCLVTVADIDSCAVVGLDGNTVG